MRKLTIEDMQALARKRRGKCLSKRYVHNHTSLRWQCADGHTWKAMPSSIKRGSWCPACYDAQRGTNLRLTLGKMQRLANKHDGMCLSKAYVNTHTPLRWQCADGHTWKARPSNIKGGNWCPVCAKARMGPHRLTLGEMQRLAKKHGGGCLSKTYVVRSPLRWQCADVIRGRPSHLVSSAEAGVRCAVETLG